MKNLTKHLYEVDTFGFTVVENVISKDFAETLKREIDIALANDLKRYNGRPGKDANHIIDLVTAGPTFLKFLDNEIIDQLYRHYLLDSYILYAYSTTLVLPNKTNPAHNIHVDTPRLIPGYNHAMQMTLALDDFTEENGATYYLPGSHKTETPPDQETFEKYSVRTVRKAGDALFWNPRCYHKAGNNNTDRTRYALSTYAVRSYMKQRFDFPRMVSESALKEAQVSERVRSILGFNSRVPSTVEDFYVSAENRLYKANQG